MAEIRLSGRKVIGSGHASVLSVGAATQRRPKNGRKTVERGKNERMRPCVGAATLKRGHVGCEGAPATGLPRENGAMSAEREPRRRGCHPKKFEISEKISNLKKI